MTIRIMLDAGHYGYQNQSPCDSRYCESKMTWALHNHLKDALTRCGFTVDVTRTDQAKDLDPYYRGAKAKGYDLFLSLHSNTATGDNRIMEDVDRPVVIRYLDSTAADDAFAQELGDAIRLCIGARQATQLYRKEGARGEYYGVLRGAKAVSCPVAFILEHGFHTCTKTTEYLLDDNNLKALAEAEAKVICAHYGYTYITSGDQPAPAPAPTPAPTPTPSSGFAVGDKVKIVSGAVYTNGVKVPDKYIGKVMNVQQVAAGRCLIQELYSWVNSSYLYRAGDSPASAPTPAPAPSPAGEIRVGSKVKIKSGAVYSNGVKVPKSCIGVAYTVRQILPTRVLLQEINSWVSKTYLEVV